MKQLSLILVVALMLAVSAMKAEAQCTPLYGGGQTCAAGNLVIDKKVANPQTGIFVDNLFDTDPKYAPDSIVTFQVRVSNTGNAALNNVVVTDIFPPYITVTTLSAGSSTDGKTVKLTIGTLNAGETQTFTFQGRVANANQFPQNRMCGDDVDPSRRIINQAIATVGNTTVQDNAKLCIEKTVSVGGPVVVITPEVGTKGGPAPVQTITKGGLKVFPAPAVTKTPATGPEMLALAALLPTGLLGQFLKKKSVK